MDMYQIEYKDRSGTTRYAHIKANSREEVELRLQNAKIDPLNPNSKTYKQDYISITKH